MYVSMCACINFAAVGMLIQQSILAAILYEDRKNILKRNQAKTNKTEHFVLLLISILLLILFNTVFQGNSPLFL